MQLVNIGFGSLIRRRKLLAVLGDQLGFLSLLVLGGVDFLLDGGGEAIAANQDHGVQVVGGSALFPALGRSQLNLGHPRIMSAARLDVMPADMRSAGAGQPLRRLSRDNTVI